MRNVRSYNLTAIQPKSQEFRYSNVQDDNLKHESTRQIKINSIMRLYLECANKCNYNCRRLFHQHLQAVSITTDLQPRKLIGICNLYISINKVYAYAVLYTVHVISQNIDGGATEADGRASAPVGPSVATPLLKTESTIDSF